MAEMSRENVIGGLRRMAVVEKMRYSQVPNPQYRVNANTVETAIALLSQQEEKQNGFTLTKEQTAEVTTAINGVINLMQMALKHGSFTFTAIEVDLAAAMRMENLVARMRRYLGEYPPTAGEQIRTHL